MGENETTTAVAAARLKADPRRLAIILGAALLIAVVALSAWQHHRTAWTREVGVVMTQEKAADGDGYVYVVTVTNKTLRTLYNVYVTLGINDSWHVGKEVEYTNIITATIFPGGTGTVEFRGRDMDAVAKKAGFSAFDGGVAYDYNRIALRRVEYSKF